MHLLDNLGGTRGDSQDQGDFEYRLLCSGEIYNGRVITGDWRHSDIARIVLQDPVALIVCSSPFNEYPQELSLRFTTGSVTEETGWSTFTQYPDNEIASDLCAVLSLLTRRLVTMAAKVREVSREAEPPYNDWPIGFINAAERIHWTHKPSTVEVGANGELSNIQDYNPPPLAVDPIELSFVLKRLPKIEMGSEIVLAARLYALALRHLETDADLAYQFLISAVETVANEALKDFQPPRDHMIAAKGSVIAAAKKLGLPKEQQEELALAACQGLPWAKRKFTKFLTDNTPAELWTPDDLFRVPDRILPTAANFSRALDTIYDGRSKLTHKGLKFPRSIGIGIGPSMKTEVFLTLNLDAPFPPVVWFERVANLALRHFIGSSIALAGA